MNLGENIKKILKNKKLSQKELAKKMELTPSAINNYIKNKTEPNIEILIKLSKELNISIDNLVNNQKEEIVLTEKKALLEKIEQLNEIECKKLNIFADGLILNRISEQKERTFKLIKDNNKGE